MKTTIAFLSLTIASCSDIDFVGAIETPYGDVTYKTPPKISNPTK